MNKVDFDTHKPLYALDAEGCEAAAVDDDGAAVVRRLAQKPVRRLSVAELCELIRRNIGLPYLVPLAIERLTDDPFLEAQQFPGDLLEAVLESDTRFWCEREDLWCAMIDVLELAVGIINRRVQEEGREDYLPWHLGDNFMAALLHFRGIHGTSDG